ncbi:MAG: ABC transporter ATP-binding protein [Planctomycetota bacterium]|nr:ABC transporter ATP-binding protein [Planctomycetota bacterium]
MLRAQKLHKFFSSNGEREVHALAEVNLECPEGDFLCLLGPTGCGKTTFLRIAAGLEKPSSGTITVKGLPPEKAIEHIGFVFQQNALFPWLNVIDNVMFGLSARNIPKDVARARARECLALVRLKGIENAYPYELSGEVQQRAAIARALAPRPDLLLLDEPFGALDEKTRKQLQDELLSLHLKNEFTVVFVTHNIEEAVYLGQRVAILDTSPGRIASEMPVELSHPRDRMSQEFVNHLLAAREQFEKVVG